MLSHQVISQICSATSIHIYVFTSNASHFWLTIGLFEMFPNVRRSMSWNGTRRFHHFEWTCAQLNNWCGHNTVHVHEGSEPLNDKKNIRITNSIRVIRKFVPPLEHTCFYAIHFMIINIMFVKKVLHYSIYEELFFSFSLMYG